MTAIVEMFGRCAEQRRSAFIPFLTAGDPSLEATADLMQAMVDGGADLIELGVPFSDPVADGPVIQRAAARALATGTTMSAILRLVARQRDRLGVPIVLFTYFNPVFVRGVENFADQAASSGVDGVLCVDLPPEEGERELVPRLGRQGVDSIYLLAPTSTKERIRRVEQASSGFVYYVSRTGVTGARDRLPRTLLKEAKRLRRRVELPLAVGFGISTPEQVASVSSVADGVVVGSALVELIGEHGADSGLAAIVERRVRELVSPLRDG